LHLDSGAGLKGSGDSLIADGSRVAIRATSDQIGEGLSACAVSLWTVGAGEVRCTEANDGPVALAAQRFVWIDYESVRGSEFWETVYLDARGTGDPLTLGGTHYGDTASDITSGGFRLLGADGLLVLGYRRPVSVPPGTLQLFRIVKQSDEPEAKACPHDYGAAAGSALRSDHGPPGNQHGRRD
jgi:hypothetical protein